MKRIFNFLRVQKTTKYPVCPQCGKNTIVLFAPPKDGLVGTPEGYKLLGTQEYVDWDKATLYCCNGSSNCRYNVKINTLTTPRVE